jgi:hypothetical protein
MFLRKIYARGVRKINVTIISTKAPPPSMAGREISTEVGMASDLKDIKSAV